MHETWYVLEDGSFADPKDVSRDQSGVLRDKSGVAVAMRDGVPHSRGMSPQERAAAIAKKYVAKDKGANPQSGKPGYRTREEKAE